MNLKEKIMDSRFSLLLRERMHFKLKRSGNKIKMKYPGLQPLWVAVFSDILGFTILIPLLPFFVQSFGASPLEVGLLLSTNALFGAIFGPILGKLSDKYGRKPLILISQGGTFAGFMILAFSTNLPMLFISRIVDGVFGGNYPIAKAIIGDVVKPRDRSVQMTNVGIAHNIANLFGPGLGGILSRFGIIGPGLMAAGLSLFTIIFTFLRLKESAPVITGITHFGIIEKNSDTSPNAKSILNVDSSQNKIVKINDGKRGIRHNRTAKLLLIQWGFHTMAFMIVMSGISLFANFKVGIQPEEIGLLLSITGAFQIFVRFVIFNPMLRKIGEIKTSKLGLGIFCIVFFAIGFIREPYQLIIIFLCFSFAASAARGILTGFLSRAVHPMDLGKVMGYNTSLDSLAQIMGPLISGFVLQSWNLIFYGFISGILSIAAFSMIFFKFEFKYEQKIVEMSGITSQIGVSKLIEKKSLREKKADFKVGTKLDVESL